MALQPVTDMKQHFYRCIHPLQGVDIPQQDLQDAGNPAALAGTDDADQQDAGDLEQLQMQQVSTRYGLISRFQ
jgi:hypothetical protein